MKSSRKNNLPIILLAGAAAYYFLVMKKPATNTTMPAFSTAPPAPPAGSPVNVVSAWANQVKSLYGNVAALWQPGGPFYSQPVPTPQQDAAANNIFWGSDNTGQFDSGPTPPPGSDTGMAGVRTVKHSDDITV